MIMDDFRSRITLRHLVAYVSVFYVKVYSAVRISSVMIFVNQLLVEFMISKVCPRRQCTAYIHPGSQVNL